MRFSLSLLIAGAVCLPAQTPAPLSLAEAQRLALQNNPQISAARFAASASYEVPKEYAANFQPGFTGSFSSVGADNGSRLAAGGLNNPVVYSRVGSGLSINQLITDFGRTGNLVGAAKLRAQAQDQVTERTRAQTLLETSRAYFAVLRAKAVLQVANQTVASRELVVEQVSALAESKLKSTLDLSFSKVNLSDAKLLQIQAQNAVKAAEADLSAAIGLPNETSFTLSEESLPSPLPDRISDLVRQALQDRPEVKQLRLQESADLRFVKAEHALFFPNLGVVGTAGFAPAGTASVPTRYGAVGLNVTIPIFNGGLFRARQTEAEMRAKSTNASVSDLENRITRDVRVAYLNATSAYDRMALTQELLTQAQSSMDLAQSRYDLGLGSIVELSQAQLSLTSAQIANTSAKYDYQALRLAVDYQVGAMR